MAVLPVCLGSRAGRGAYSCLLTATPANTAAPAVGTWLGDAGGALLPMTLVWAEGVLPSLRQDGGSWTRR